ncbi:MAG: PKD domain-containing protein [Deinococcales bacterium]
MIQRRYSPVIWIGLCLFLLVSCQQPAELPEELMDRLEFSDYPEESAAITGEVEVLSRFSVGDELLGLLDTASLASLGLEAQSLGFILGEAGRLKVSQLHKDQWYNLTFMSAFKDPIVIMQPLSFNSGQPAHIRIKEVTSEGVVFQIDEWDYLSTPSTGNGSHPAEEFSYLVWEKSALALQGGLVIEAGTLTVDHSWKSFSLSLAHSSQPLLLTQIQSYNGSAAVVTRQRYKRGRSFEVRLQEEEKADGLHAPEVVAYLAISRGRQSWGDVVLTTGFTGDRVTQNWYTQGFNQNGVSAETPVFLASIQGYRGAEPAGIRYKDLGAAGVKVRVEEEKSKDTETLHPAENVGYLLLQRPSQSQRVAFDLESNQTTLATCQALELSIRNLTLPQGLTADDIEYYYSFGDSSRQMTTSRRLTHSYDRTGNYIVQVDVRKKASNETLGSQSKSIRVMSAETVTYIALITKVE